jgi:8-oxo-dGTP pyrophosphatase MutT (NUDIX family)
MSDAVKPPQPQAPQAKHQNDIYGDDIALREGGSPVIPAATVVLLREAPDLEVLMLHKSSSIAFGGMWVFPGGRVDPEDYPADGDPNAAARNAAVRETFEEAGIAARPEEFVWFAHWTPPPSTPKRFATWFFAAVADDHQVRIDGGEIQNHQWLSPALALQRHAAGEIDLAPPTWVTLYQLSLYPAMAPLLDRMRGVGPRYYETRLAKRSDSIRVAMWQGDAGYAGWDADVPGQRHRLVMSPGGFVFENSVESY